MAVLGTVEGPLIVLPEGWSQVELAAVFVAVSGVVLTGTAVAVALLGVFGYNAMREEAGKTAEKNAEQAVARFPGNTAPYIIAREVRDQLRADRRSGVTDDESSDWREAFGDDFPNRG